MWVTQIRMVYLFEFVGADIYETAILAIFVFMDMSRMSTYLCVLSVLFRIQA